MTTTTETPFSQSYKESVEKYADLGYIYDMYCYTNTIARLQPPAKIPPDQPGMAQAISISQLITNAKATSAKWDSHLNPMAKVAQNITNYAKASKLAVTTLTKRTQNELNSEAFTKLTPDRKQSLKKEFAGIINTLKGQATKYAKEAADIRDRIAAYKLEIEKDYTDAKQVQTKYKDWLKKEADDMKAWEQQHGIPVGETDKLIAKIRQEIGDAAKKHSKMLTGLEPGTDSDVASVFINLTVVGLIYTLVTINSGEAKNLRDSITKWNQQLARLGRFNEVKVFFDTSDKLLVDLINACNLAVQALGGIQGQWEQIRAKLDGLGGEVASLDLLQGWGDAWEAPIEEFTSNMVTEDYDEVIKLCDHYVRYLYIKDLNTARS